eukprot:scaffold66313_cov50-Attheya_sp.AAC.4
MPPKSKKMSGKKKRSGRSEAAVSCAQCAQMVSSSLVRVKAELCACALASSFVLQGRRTRIGVHRSARGGADRVAGCAPAYSTVSDWSRDKPEEGGRWDEE